MRSGGNNIVGKVRGLRDAGGVLQLVRGNIELWANLLILSWAIGFMLWQGPGFAITIATVFGIWAILAISLNLVVGFTGLLSVGHIGFFGIGAYTVAILTSNAPYEQLRTEAIPTFGWPFFRGAAGGRGSGRRCGAGGRGGVQPVSRRHLRPGVLRVHHHFVQRVPELEKRDERGFRDTRNRPANGGVEHAHGRAGIPRAGHRVPGHCAWHLAVHCHVFVRQGADGHTRG